MAISYDPIAVLMEEHQGFLRRLEEVRTDLQRLSGEGRGARAVAASMSTFADFLAKDVDGFHGRKEEEGLFPILVRHIGSEGGPVGVMLEEHGLLRRHQKTIARNVPKLETDLEAVEAWTAVSVATDAVDRLLADHIEKEDRVLFPMARAVLTPAEMSEVAEICEAIEVQLGASFGVRRPAYGDLRGR
ncbi:MAG: hypothetical protein HKL79_02130 [Thermoplasmata archaeon]|nr:hypothetical protein [Thermoplasmata archaeon]